MTRPHFKYLSLLAIVLILSAVSSGFLVGRTAKLHEEGKMEQMQLMGEQVVTAFTIVSRGVEVVKRVILR